MTRRATSVFAFVFTLAIVAVTYVPQIDAPFELQDDHRIIAPLLTPHPGGISGAVRMWASTVRQDVDEVGRFRPVNQIFDVIGPLVLGPHPMLWHCLSIALAIAVAALLFIAALRLWQSPAAAAVFALVTLLAPDPGPTAAWYRLGPKEAWGMLFLAAALAVMARAAGKFRWSTEILLFVLIVLTGLSKESFLLLVPALYGLRVWLDARATNVSPFAAIGRLRFAGIAYGALFLAAVVAVAYVVRSAGAHSYGARSLGGSAGGTMQIVLRDLARTPSLSIWFLPVLLALPAAWRRRRPGAMTLLAAAIFCAWIGPQFLLHATRGGFWDHYWLPCLVAFAAINAASVAMLAHEPRPILYRVALLLFGIWLVNSMRIDLSSVINFKTKARVQQEAVRIAAANVTPASILVIVADADVESERAPSFVDFVSVSGGRFRRALLYDSRCTAQPCRFVDLRSGQQIDSIDRRDISTVVHLDQTQPAVPPSWFSGAAFRSHNAVGSFHFLSLRHHGWVAIPFTIPVDVLKTGGA